MRLNSKAQTTPAQISINNDKAMIMPAVVFLMPNFPINKLLLTRVYHQTTLLSRKMLTLLDPIKSASDISAILLEEIVISDHNFVPDTGSVPEVLYIRHSNLTAWTAGSNCHMHHIH